MNILVVDDDPEVLALVGGILSSAGHRITAMTDAREAIQEIARGDVDLLVSDAAMSTMSGPELLSEARRLQPKLPVLLVSESPVTSDCTFLATPFQTQDLLNAVHQALAFNDLSTASPRNHSNGAMSDK